MLVLTRQRRESIVIGDEVMITVLSITPENVRLGITAPGEVPVHREEIHRRNLGLPPRPSRARGGPPCDG